MRVGDTFDVEVKQQDINLGTKNSCQFCPIARAMRRTMNKMKVPQSWRLRVNGDELVVNSHNTTKIAAATEAARKRVENFIGNFDTGMEVRPFTFKAKLI